MNPYLELKQELLKRKEELEHQFDFNNEFGMEIPLASTTAGELSQYDNHPADSGAQLFEREKDIILRKMAHEELADIYTALAKFEDGTYGIDEKTGEKIPLERLQALPTARTTKENSPNQEINRHDRPIEESVISNMEKEYATDSQETEYNEQNAYDIVASFNENSMTYDGSSLIDNEDGMGYVELVEAIGATGIEGYQGDDQVQFLRNIQYDKWMNQENIAEDDE